MQTKWFLSALAALAVLSGSVETVRILAVVPTPSRSHHIWNRALILALAKRGHQMTVLSPDSEKEPVQNLKHINLEDSYHAAENLFVLEDLVKDGAIDSLKAIWTWGLEMCRHQTMTKGAKELLSMPPDSFDLIIMETVLSDCMYMYIHHFGGGTKIPVVGMTAFGIGPWTDVITGARTMPSVFAFPVMPYLTKMNFWERLCNTLITGIAWAGEMYYFIPEHQKIAEKAYGKPLPPIAELGSNISLILVNNHYVINGPQALLPGIIEVGGMQCSPPNPLPKDIQAFLDGSEKGAIFFSLGSNLKSELLPKEKLQVIVKTFAALGPKIRVLWKFDPKVPIEGVPSNVLMKKWLPQEDVLGHPKLLAFVSHGGLLSTQEAIYHGVPVVNVPFFADQHTNSKRIEDMKVAKKIDFLTVTKESFTETILSVINDPSYRQNMQKLSRLFRDQPETPLDRAIFWTEFALRHDKGRIHNLRSAGLDLAWYQYFLLDVLVVILLAVVLVLFMAVLIIHLLYRMIMRLGKNSGSSKNSKKQR